jgi:hypothetical protein
LKVKNSREGIYCIWLGFFSDVQLCNVGSALVIFVNLSSIEHLLCAKTVIGPEIRKSKRKTLHDCRELPVLWEVHR